jgi:hypothetical protein
MVWTVFQIKIKLVSCHTADSKPVKQEVNGTVILSHLVFPAQDKANFASRGLSYKTFYPVACAINVYDHNL